MKRNSTPTRRDVQFGALSTAFNVALSTLAWSPAATAAARQVRLVAFGDSLMAGFQIALTDAFPAQLERALRAKGYDVEVANAGVSGDTTAAGLVRLDWAIPDATDAVILEFGANDMLRGIDPATVRRNLDQLVTRITKKGSRVLLTGMRSVGNWGDDYRQSFDAIFPELARAHRLPLYPFFLAGVVGDKTLNLDDGLHPNPRGVQQIVSGILPTVEELLAQLHASTGKKLSPG